MSIIYFANVKINSPLYSITIPESERQKNAS